MSGITNCNQTKRDYASQRRFNEIGADLATASTITTCLVYGWNTFCLFYITPNTPRPRQQRQQRQPRHLRRELAVSPISALLASAVGIVLIFAVCPQPFEGAALLVVALAQASVLDWQDHDPQTSWKGFQ